MADSRGWRRQHLARGAPNPSGVGGRPPAICHLRCRAERVENTEDPTTIRQIASSANLRRLLERALPHPLLQVAEDVLDLRQRGPQVVGDLLGEDVWLGEAGGILQALIAEPEQVQADRVAGDDLVIGVRTPAAGRRLPGPRRLAEVALARAVALDELVEVGSGGRWSGRAASGRLR